MKRHSIKYQIIQLDIPSAGKTVTPIGKVKTEKQFNLVTGITISCTDALGFTNSVFTKFEIDQREIYPVGFVAKLISSGQEVNPDDKFDKDINECVNESVIDIAYTDGSAYGIVYPYTVNIYLRHERTTIFRITKFLRHKLDHLLGKK